MQWHHCHAETFQKWRVKSQLTLDSQRYLAPAQGAFCANYSLASTILTNFPEAVGHYLVNRVLFTAQWHIISIRRAAFPDTSDLIWWVVAVKDHQQVSLGCPASSARLWHWLLVHATHFTHRQENVASISRETDIACRGAPSTLTPPMHFITWFAALTFSEIHVCQQILHMPLPAHS